MIVAEEIAAVVAAVVAVVVCIVDYCFDCLHGKLEPAAAAVVEDIGDFDFQQLEWIAVFGLVVAIVGFVVVDADKTDDLNAYWDSIGKDFCFLHFDVEIVKR